MTLHRTRIFLSLAVRHALIARVILAGATAVLATLPGNAASPADCSGTPERGVWVAAKMIPPPSLPSGKGGTGQLSALGCGRVYTCQAKVSMIIDSRCKVVSSPDQTIHGTCAWSGHGPPDTCDTCLTSATSASDCKWHLEKR